MTIILLFIFLLSSISFASADSFSMNYVGNSGDVISISSGIEDEIPAEEIPPAPSFADLLICAFPNPSFPFNIWISIDCFKKLIDIWD